MHRHVDPEIPLRQTGHREHGRGRRRKGILAALDPVDDRRAPLPRLPGGEVAVPPETDAPEPGRPSGLDHVDLAAAGVDAHAEAGEVAVPEDGILLLDAKRVDGALGDSEFASPRHGAPSPIADDGRRAIRHQTAHARHQIGGASKRMHDGNTSGANGEEGKKIQ